MTIFRQRSRGFIGLAYSFESLSSGDSVPGPLAVSIRSVCRATAPMDHPFLRGAAAR
jgi:hypothetical protein